MNSSQPGSLLSPHVTSGRLVLSGTLAKKAALYNTTVTEESHHLCSDSLTKYSEIMMHNHFGLLLI